MGNLRKIRIVAVAAVSFAGAAWGQQAEPAKKPEAQQEQTKPDQIKKETPAVLPSAALSLGAKMAESASPGFLKWARGYAKREILEHTPPREHEAVRKAIEARYLQAPEPARAAGVFLVWYVAYEQATKTQDAAGERVRDIERVLNRLADDLAQIRNTAVPISAVDAQRDEEGRILGRLEDATRERDLFQRNLDIQRARVDLCLQRLAALHEALKDSDTSSIRQLK